MSLSGKKIAGIAAAVVLVAAIAAYFIYIPKLEQQFKEDITAFIDATEGISVDSLDVDMSGKILTLNGLKGKTKYIDGSDMQFVFDQVTLKGINLDAAQKSGVIHIADSLEIKNATLNFENSELSELTGPFTQTTKIQSLSAKNIRGDVVNANQAWPDIKNPVFLDAIQQYSLESLHMAGYEADVLMLSIHITSSMDTITCKKFSLNRIEDYEAINMKSSYAFSETQDDYFSGINMDALSAFNHTMTNERFFVKSVSAPNLLNILSQLNDIADDADGLKAVNLFFDSLSEPIEVQGMELEGMRIVFEGLDAISLKSMKSDYTLGSKSVAMKMSLDEVEIPVSLYNQSNIDAAQFATYYGKPLVFDGKLEADFTVEEDRGVFKWKNLALVERNLGGFDASMDILMQGQEGNLFVFLMSSRQKYLEQMKLGLEDKGLVNTYLESEYHAHYGTEQESDSIIANQREQYANHFKSLVASMNLDQERQNIADSLAALIAAPGKVTVEIAPSQPMDLSRLNPRDLMSAPLNAKAEYIPAQ